MKLKIKVEPTENEREWKLLETLLYRGTLVPSGFVFDGASIPPGLRILFPHGGKKFFAACVHDWCYRTGCVSRASADILFLTAMKENNVTPWKAKAMYKGVRVFGVISWYKHRRLEDANV